MATVQTFVRSLGLLAAVGLGVAGGFGLAHGRSPDQGVVAAARRTLDRWAPHVAPPLGLPPRGDAVANLLSKHAVPLLLGGGFLLAAVLLVAPSPRRRTRESKSEESARAEVVDRGTARRVGRQANSLAKKGHVHEAAELCFASGLLDRAAELFVQAGELVRAAEIRHDQNRFSDAAELYRRAGEPESAGTIYASQGGYALAADCFIACGRTSVAAEMLEKAGEFRRAGDCYVQAGFHRHAAQAYVRCQAWEPAARAIEEAVREDGLRVGGRDPRKEKELRKLVLQAGRLYEQAGLLDRAEKVLEEGGCPGLAAEIALRRERFARASELFLAANEPLRAAEALGRTGEEEAAARILGEYHRERGEDQEAAQQFEAGGEFGEAAELFRKLEDYPHAAVCYERAGELAQAAAMYRLAGEPARAAPLYDRAERFEEAAECHAASGDHRREAEALSRAGRLHAAGEAYHRQDEDDAAIMVLQKVEPSSPDFQAASGLLGEIFRSRGMHSLAIKKLRQALGTAELGRENVRAFYTLATIHEENGELREAVDVYEKILAIDYHYEDVEPRLSAARAQLRSAAPGDSSGSDPPGVAAASTPTNPGRYQILGELGRGGMGIVYKAQDTVLDRLVAYKVLPDSLKENPQALRNFLREAKSAAQLNHPNIVTVYDAGEQDGRYYIAMEYVDGTTLKQIVRRSGAISTSGLFHVLIQMCEGLAYAHDKKIIHRDVKTANTMWTRERKAKIMDFGLAKVVEEVRNHTTMISGTPYYMSPEQTLGQNVDQRSDIYSLGVTLFELATGMLPFREGNVPYHHVHTPAPDPREANPKLPPLLTAVIVRCLLKEPAERYQSTREIVAEVRAKLGPAASRGLSKPA